MSALDRLERPLIQGGMGIGVSMGNLAGAVAAEGAMGVISTANHRVYRRRLLGSS